MKQSMDETILNYYIQVDKRVYPIIKQNYTVIFEELFRE